MGNVGDNSVRHLKHNSWPTPHPSVICVELLQGRAVNQWRADVQQTLATQRLRDRFCQVIKFVDMGTCTAESKYSCTLRTVRNPGVDIRFANAGLLAEDSCQCLRHLFGGGILPPQKKLTASPQTAAKLCALNLFFSRDSELQIYHGNSLLMDNKRRKLFANKQSEGCRFMPKMHQNTFGGRAPPRPAGGAYATCILWSRIFSVAIAKSQQTRTGLLPLLC